MKKSIFLLIVLFCALTQAKVQGQSPMCDGKFGYCYRTDTSANPVAYEWIDISQTGTRLEGLGDDNVAGPLNIGFDFTYYWTKYNQIYLGTNGYVMFGQITNVASTGTGFPTFPTPTGNPLISNYVGLLLCDLTFTDAKGQPVPNAAIKYQTVRDSLFVVTYENVPFWVREVEDVKGYAGSNTFQIVLHKNSGNITINYQKQEGEYSSAYRGAAVPVSIGMENNTGDIGLQFWGESGVLPRNNSALRVFRPAQSSFQIKDARVEWVFNPNTYARMISLDQAQNITDIKARVGNSGTTVMKNVTARRRIYDPANQRWLTNFEEDYTITELKPGESTDVLFETTPVVLANPGIYEVRVQLRFEDAGDDEVTNNNSVRAQLNITDERQIDQVVGYESYDVSFPLLEQWKGQGNVDFSARFKVGTYFEPPYYPCQLTDLYVSQFITANPDADTLLGFKCVIFDDDGPNGGPGTKLTELTCSAERLASFYTEEPDTPRVFFVPMNIETKLNIASGGVYISWEQPAPADPSQPQHNDLLLLDSDISYPKSNRLFEISGGLWAPHRSRPEEDMVIKYGIKQPTGINDAPIALTLKDPYPNPAQGQLNIPCHLKEQAPLSYSITDGLGRTVIQQNLGILNAGNHLIEVNTDDLTPGIYACKMSVGNRSLTKMFVVSR